MKAGLARTSLPHNAMLQVFTGRPCRCCSALTNAAVSMTLVVGETAPNISWEFSNWEKLELYLECSSNGIEITSLCSSSSNGFINEYLHFN